MNKNIQSIKSSSGLLTWINVVNAQKREIDYLRRKFKFNELDLEDSYAKNYAQRPKLSIRNDYCFLVLQFPLYNRKTRNIESEEIDFFIGKDYVITIHKNSLTPIIELYNLCANDQFYRDQYLHSGNEMLLYEIVSKLQEYCFPIMDHISIDIKNIEQNIFTGLERRMVTEILLIKRNILNFRKIMEAHKNVIQKMVRMTTPYFIGESARIYYNDAIENTKNIWETLNSQKEMIEALEDTNTSLVSFKLNDIMRILTIFSVLVLPLTLVSGVFGMNTVDGMPFMNNPRGFWFIIVIMLSIMLLMISYFKRKKWL